MIREYSVKQGKMSNKQWKKNLAIDQIEWGSTFSGMFKLLIPRTEKEIIQKYQEECSIIFLGFLNTQLGFGNSLHIVGLDAS